MGERRKCGEIQCWIRPSTSKLFILIRATSSSCECAPSVFLFRRLCTARRLPRCAKRKRASRRVNLPCAAAWNGCVQNFASVACAFDWRSLECARRSKPPLERPFVKAAFQRVQACISKRVGFDGTADRHT